jgi:hypothetical protein
MIYIVFQVKFCLNIFDNVYTIVFKIWAQKKTDA